MSQHLDQLARRAQQVAAAIDPPFVRVRCDYCGGRGVVPLAHPNDDPRLAEDPCGQCDGRRAPGAASTHVWCNSTLAGNPRVMGGRHSDFELIQRFFGHGVEEAYPALGAALRTLPDGWGLLEVEDIGSDTRRVTFTDRAGNTKALPAIERDDLEDRDRGADLGRRVRELFKT